MLTSGYGGSDFSYRKPPGLGLGNGASMDYGGSGAPTITTDLPTPPAETVVGISYPMTPTALQAQLALPTNIPAPTTKDLVNEFTNWINANKTYVYALLAVLGVVSFLKRK